MDLWLLVFLLVVVQPVLGYLRFRRLAARPGPLSTAAKLRLYAVVCGSQWVLTLACAWVLARRRLGLGDLGLTAVPPRWAVAAAGLATVGLVGGTWLSLRALARAPAARIPSQVRKVTRILPATARERAGFLVVALTAGVCEEILYRGFLIYAFDRVLPAPGISLALAALAFGGAHAYQGPRGVATTGILGGFLGLLYVLGGSLWPGMALHVVVDLANGYALGPLGRRLEESPS